MIVFALVYRPQSCSKALFLEEISGLFETVLLKYDKAIVSGDFNVHFDNDEGDSFAKQFANLLNIFNLVQHVDVPTHSASHTLDLVITRELEDLVKKPLAVAHWDLSDHTPITFTIPVTSTAINRKEVSFRDYRNMDTAVFKNVFMSNIGNNFNSLSVDRMVERFDTAVRLAVEATMPLKTLVFCPSTFRMASDTLSVRRERRRLERMYRKAPCATAAGVLRAKRSEFAKLIKRVKECFFNGKISNATDPKQLYSIVNLMLHRKERSFPTNSDPATLANQFQEFFAGKVRDAQQGCASSHNEAFNHSSENAAQVPLGFHHFRQVTVD